MNIGKVIVLRVVRRVVADVLYGGPRREPVKDAYEIP